MIREIISWFDRKVGRSEKKLTLRPRKYKKEN